MVEIFFKILIWLGVVIFLAALGWLVYFVLQLRAKGHIRRSLDMSLFLIRLPQYEKERQSEQSPKELIGRAEQLYSAFSSLKSPGFWQRFIFGPPRVTFEIASESQTEEVGFYIAVPKDQGRQLEKILHGIYPDASIQEMPEDYNIFVPRGQAAASILKLEKGSFLPINTYQHLESDPLGQITTALSKLKKNQGAAFQIIITPASSGWKKAGSKIIKFLREGKSLKEAVHLAYSIKIGAKKKKQKNEGDPISITVDEKKVEGVQSKISKVAFQTNIRLIASAQDQPEAEAILNQLEGAFGQFASPDWNSFKSRRLAGRKLKQVVFDFSFRNFNPRASSVLNTEELASLFHLHLAKLEIPKLKALKTREAPLPKELPQQGVLILGKAVYRGETQLIKFAGRQDRRRHLYAIGQTGTGKTSFFQEMIRQDIEAGEGVGVIDPHGDLIEATLANIPRNRFKDVVLFEPADTGHPIGLNMLEWEKEEERDFAVQEMIAIFQKLFPPEIIGPMFEHYMRNAMLALMASKENTGTLVEIPRIFTDDEFMQKKLEQVQDPVVRQFWLKEWKQTTGQMKSDMLGYVVSKVGRFVGNEIMRNIIGQSRSSFDLGKIMDEKKIFLANLSKGKTGEINSSLLGLILVSKLQMAALRRAGLPEEQRNDFYLYIDEFQNFTTDSIATILSEARKYRLNLNITHQFIKQLDEKIRDAVFGNVGTLVSFRVSAEDGEIMEKQFEPEFSRHDLINLDNFNAIIKLMINGQTTAPFRMRTLKPKPGNPEAAGPIRQASRAQYGRPKAQAEKEISERAKF